MPTVAREDYHQQAAGYDTYNAAAYFWLVSNIYRVFTIISIFFGACPLSSLGGVGDIPDAFTKIFFYPDKFGMIRFPDDFSSKLSSFYGDDY